MTNGGFNGFPAAGGPYASKAGPLNWGIVTNVGPVVAVAAATAFPAVNRVNYYRLVDGGTPISKARIRIGTQSGNVAVAYYANSGFGTAAVPGTLLASSGIVACGSSASDQDIPLRATVSPGAGDWVAIWADNTTVTIFAASGSSLASTIYAGRVYLQDSATTGPPPTPSSLTTGASRVFDIVGIP